MDGTRLLVVGHGEVATALEAIARALGWSVTVVDSHEETVEALGRSDSVGSTTCAARRASTSARTPPPGEIAVSIVAEIIALRRGVSGGSLSDRSGPIHPGLPPGTAECPSG